jgi:hypothetical protein
LESKMSEYKYPGGTFTSRLNHGDRFGSADDSVGSTGGFSRQASTGSVDNSENAPYISNIAPGVGNTSQSGAFFLNPNTGVLPPGATEITAVRILQDPPVENCELRPFVLLRDHKGNQSADLAEEVLRYK